MDITQSGNEFVLTDAASGWRLRFTCAARITPPGGTPFVLDGHWTILTHTANRLVAETARHGISQQIDIRLTPERQSAEVRQLREHLPTVRWMKIDDGYQVSRVNPPLKCLPDGELDYDLPTELIGWRHNPGVTFAFTEGDGEDRAKFPDGLLGLARQIRAAGLRPGLWLGLEASQHTPVAQKHPDWFQPVQNGERWLLDVSIPEVRAEMERVFRTYYQKGGFESIKLDFWSPLFEHPDLAFRHAEKMAAEWRAWFFEMLRSCLPDDGFISLGCDLSAGAPFLARWVDSYRHSMDMRDGDWENIKRNVRWSLVPLLTHGFGQPIADADSMSLFKRLTLDECQCWADYAYVTGSLVEIGGNPQRWQAAQVAWLRQYLDAPCAGERVWIGDDGAWQRDALPSLFYRRRDAGDTPSFLASLHNWHDEARDVSSLDWAGPIRDCTH